MKAYGSGCIDPHFLELGTSWRWVVNFTPWPLYPRGKSPRYPLSRWLGGPQSRSGRFGEEKINDPTGTRTPIPLSSSPPVILGFIMWSTIYKSVLVIYYVCSTKHCIRDRFQAIPQIVLLFATVVRKRTIPTQRSSHIGEVSAKFEDRGCRLVSAMDPHGRYSRFSRPGAATFPFK
jgi:hypothetical protein